MSGKKMAQLDVEPVMNYRSELISIDLESQQKFSEVTRDQYSQLNGAETSVFLAA